MLRKQKKVNVKPVCTPEEYSSLREKLSKCKQELSKCKQAFIRGPLSIATPGNITAFTDDLLDWDAGVDAAPPRRSGKISVTLRYAGRGVPRPLGDY